MFRLFPLALVLPTLCLSAAVLSSQDQAGSSAPETRTVPQAIPASPFPADPANAGNARSIEFRPAEQMTQKDRLLAADAESSIAEHAHLNGFALEDGRWTTQQIVCPALPNHLFLTYARNNGARDVTVFSASIPRNGEGRVRIIPILRRGYSLFSPAPINAITISAFNHIRAEEGDFASKSWVGNALCYAALTGAHPQIASVDAEPGIQKPVPAMTAQLEIAGKGDEVIRFADAAAQPRPMLWTMTFTRKGKLIKATHAPAPLITARPVPGESSVQVHASN